MAKGTKKEKKEAPNDKPFKSCRDERWEKLQKAKKDK